jgi:uncharacterized BrkB/YihY/UPF0761 family membrane protein
MYSGGLGTAKVLRAISAVAWGQPVERMKHSWLAPLVTLGVAVAVGGSIVALQVIRQDSERIGLIFVGTEVVLLVVLWVVVSLILPHDPRATWLDMLPGAVVVGLGMWLLHVVSVYFLAGRVASASELYGSLGVAAALLAWLYLLGRLLVAAAMLDATLFERRERDGRDEGEVTTRGG